MIKFKTFRRLMLLLALLLVPTTLLFAYANRYSQDELKQNLETSAAKQLQFTVTSLEQSLKQVETQALLLINDSGIKAYGTAADFQEYVDHLFLRKSIEEKLSLQKEANPLIDSITAYWPRIGETITTRSGNDLTERQWIDAPRNKWFRRVRNGETTFHLIFANPTYPAADLGNATALVDTAISERYLRSVLEGMEMAGNGTAFFHFEGAPLVSIHPDDASLASALSAGGAFDGVERAPVRRVLTWNDVEVLVQTVYSPTLEGTLVSYVRVDDFLRPLQRMNRLVIASLIFLFLAGLAFTGYLYRHYRLPFGYLVRKLESLGAGDYKSRANITVDNEFRYVFERFNEMASRIQSLIENVYEERVRTQEAEYKHLQSQINPHFLYNCLYFIVGMAHKSPDAVVSMSKNLGNYYRYITRKAGTEVTLADELQLVESYLQVQSLRNKRLSYEIDVPAAMRDIIVPTLLLQPVVENAVVHGLEGKRDSGRISIRGGTTDGRYVLTVDDDGAGLSPEALDNLRRRVYAPLPSDEAGNGLRNIHLRLANRYGGRGAEFEAIDGGGLRVVLHLLEKN